MALCPSIYVAYNHAHISVWFSMYAHVFHSLHWRDPMRDPPSTHKNGSKVTSQEKPSHYGWITKFFTGTNGGSSPKSRPFLVDSKGHGPRLWLAGDFKQRDQQGASKLVFLQKEAHIVLKGPHWQMKSLGGGLILQLDVTGNSKKHIREAPQWRIP